MRTAGRAALAALAATALILGASAAQQDEAALVFAGHDGTAWDVWWARAGQPERVTSELEAAGPSLAPDGRIAAADAAGAIVVRAPTGALSTVPGTPRPCGQPDWSADARRLAFACFRFHNRQDDGALWVASMTDGESSQIFDAPGLQKSPTWSPDGKQLAFVSGFRLTASRVVEQIWALDLESGTASQLIQGDDGAINPVWSPDGERLAFASHRTGNLEIWVHELSSGRTYPVTSHPAYDDEPAWSPDGQEIAFTSTRGGELEIWAAPAAGGEARRLVAAPSGKLRSARSPSWRALAGGNR